MNELLPITESDIREAAEKLGWGYSTRNGTNARPPDAMFALFYDGGDIDCNAAAILAIERMILVKELIIVASTFGVNVTQAVYDLPGIAYVNFDENQFNAPNFRSWLIVQIVKALPKSVFESVQEESE